MKGFLQIVLGMVSDCKRFRFCIYSTCLTPRPLISLGSYNRFVSMTQPGRNILITFQVEQASSGLSGIGASGSPRGQIHIKSSFWEIQPTCLALQGISPAWGDSTIYGIDP